MNVGQLKKLIADLPDDVKVVVPFEDHNYREPRAEVTTALHHRRDGWTEDHGEEYTPERQYGKRQKVVLVS